MKQIARFFTAMTAAALIFISCQNPGRTPDKGKDIPENKDDDKKIEYTVSFNTNVPDRDGSVWYYCSDSAPEDVKIEKGKTVTLPSFTGELCKIIGSDEEGVYSFVKWNTSVGGGKNWINISGCNPSSSDGSYEYTVSGSQLKIHGRIAFGMPMDTTWYK